MSQFSLFAMAFLALAVYAVVLLRELVRGVGKMSKDGGEIVAAVRAHRLEYTPAFPARIIAPFVDDDSKVPVSTDLTAVQLFAAMQYANRQVAVGKQTIPDAVEAFMNAHGELLAKEAQTGR